MSSSQIEIPARGGNITSVPAPTTEERKGLTKKEIAADHPTWCPGCGDFSVLALYFKLIEKRKLWHEKVTTIAGIGCSSRFPYFVQAPGAHYTHTARKNIKLTYVVMDNWVYGLTKKQTSPTSPIGFKSKTDVTGSLDQPINPMKQAISAGATFVARTTHTNPNHVLQMMEAAMDHDGFSFVECLSECVEFYEGAFDASNPRKGGVFNLVAATHDVTDEIAAYKLADEPFPGSFGIFYRVNKPTKNAREAGIISSAREKVKGLKDWEILQKSFERMK